MSETQATTNVLQGFRESLTGFVGVIDSDHAYIHQGIAYTTIIESGSISSVYYVGFHTPAVSTGKYIHWRPTLIITSEDQVAYHLYEDLSFTGGTNNVIFDRNRVIDSTSNMVVTKGVTATPSSELIISSYIIGTTGSAVAQAGGASGAEHEIILLPDTDYVLAMTPEGSTNTISTIFWYEESLGQPE